MRLPSQRKRRTPTRARVRDKGASSTERCVIDAALPSWSTGSAVDPSLRLLGALHHPRAGGRRHHPCLRGRRGGRAMLRERLSHASRQPRPRTPRPGIRWHRRLPPRSPLCHLRRLHHPSHTPTSLRTPRSLPRTLALLHHVLLPLIVTTTINTLRASALLTLLYAPTRAP